LCHVLAQIRAKEAQKLEAEMTRNPEDTKRRAMLQRLPELTRIVRAYLLRLFIYIVILFALFNVPVGTTSPRFAAVK